MNPRQRVSRRFAIGAGFGVPLASVARAAYADGYTMRLSHPNSPTSAFNAVALRFADTIARRSNGAIKVDVYPSGQLARQSETVDGLTSGVLDFAIAAASLLFPLYPRYQVLNLPFLFKTLQAGFRVLDGPVGTDLFDELGSHGVVGLGWGVNGLQQIETTSKNVAEPDDLKGLRIRVDGGTIFTSTFQALGAIPVAIDFSEVRVALSQRSIDGLAVVLDGFVSSKYFDIVKHVALTNHNISLTPLLGSKRKLDALPVPLQTVVKDAGKEAIRYWRSLLPQQTAVQMETLKANGVTVSDIQYPAFRRAVDPVYQMLQSKLGGDLVDRVVRAAQ